MRSRLAGFAFVAIAGLCDLAGSHSAAFYFLLVAVSAIAVACLGAVADCLEARNSGARSFLVATNAALWALALVLAVLGSSVRSAALGEGAVPPLGVSSLAASLCVFGLLGALALRERRPPSRRARPAAR